MDFFNQINMLYGTITEFCTEDSCPIMSAGRKYEYHWADGTTVKKPIKCSAPKYIDYLMSWVQCQLDDESLFPSRIGLCPFGCLLVCLSLSVSTQTTFHLGPRFLRGKFCQIPWVRSVCRIPRLSEALRYVCEYTELCPVKKLQLLCSVTLATYEENYQSLLLFKSAICQVALCFYLHLCRILMAVRFSFSVCLSQYPDKTWTECYRLIFRK